MYQKLVLANNILSILAVAEANVFQVVDGLRTYSSGCLFTISTNAISLLLINVILIDDFFVLFWLS